MVVLAISIVTKSGKPIVSRQSIGMSRPRVEGLLSSFPKLIPPNSQHTSVETDDVRFVYQPLEDLYILLITNKASNILLDIDTLHLVSRVVSDICRSADEREVSRNQYELLNAFDEVVSLGYREPVNLMQIRNVLEMESHEEKIQEIISRNKEAEAKEELKRRAKQLELQRREQARRAQQSGYSANSGGFGGGMGAGVSGGYSSVPRYETTSPTPKPAYSGSSTPVASKAPAFKGSGMKLGKKAKQSDLAEALGGEMEQESLLGAASSSAPPEPEPVPTIEVPQVELPTVAHAGVHVTTKESLSLTLRQAGGLSKFELKGDLNILISDPSATHVKVTLNPLSEVASTFDAKSLQFKYHPKLARTPGQQGPEREIRLKDPSQAWPLNSSLGVLRWRAVSLDESLVPLSITCWPSPSGDGTCDVNIEYELEHESLELINLAIAIPLPEGAYPTVAHHTGSWQLDPSNHSLLWTVPRVSSSDETRSGSLEFSVGGEDASVFFPVKINFTGLSSLIGIEAAGVEQEGASVDWSSEKLLTTEDYVVV